jgi:hypothetical protein
MMGVSMSKLISASGVSDMRDPSAVIQGRKFGLRAGINTAKNEMKISGGNFELRYYPVMETTKLKIYFSGSSIINYNTKLAYNNSVLMNTGYQAGEINLDKCSVSEHYAGFGLEYRLFGYFSIESSLGIGYFHVTVSDQLKYGAPAVMAKIGGSIYFYNSVKKKQVLPSAEEKHLSKLQRYEQVNIGD